jgi:hypothetical protein
MARMIPFKYAGFFDVPRYIFLSYRDRLLLLRSEFDDDLDEYEANYTVFILPESVGDCVQKGNWDFYNKTAMTEVGQIPVNTVKFDETNRNELDASCLDDLMTELEAAG